jgi:hypothetical protein
MIFHYLGNLFVYSLTGYIQETASVAIQVLYGVTFTFGLIPVILMILWIRFFSAKWPFEGEFKITKMITKSTTNPPENGSFSDELDPPVLLTSR